MTKPQDKKTKSADRLSRKEAERIRREMERLQKEAERLRAEQVRKRRRAAACLAAVMAACAVVLAFRVVPHASDLAAARREQSALSELGPFGELSALSRPNLRGGQTTQFAGSSFDDYWRAVNPDYAGWLRVDGTEVNFPVARGNDNAKYMNTSFRGEQNIAGAIFMDYRAEVDAPHVIIYGHQINGPRYTVPDGSHINDAQHIVIHRQTDEEKRNRLMFGGLTDFAEADFLAKHPEIKFMRNDSVFVFEIFAAGVSDIRDAAYQLDFSAPGSFESFLERIGAPPDAKRIITLSTCFGIDNDRRMIVQGALTRITPARDENGGIGWAIRQ